MTNYLIGANRTPICHFTGVHYT